MVKISLIIPVYNRPDEMLGLLKSLETQSDQDFEVIVVEDGSQNSCDSVIKDFSSKLDLHYFFKENSGPGLSRNYGAERGKGDYFIFFDSDCIIPPEYIATVRKTLQTNYSDAFGGPSRADESFTTIQKAISYSMTSIFTTGGIRGNKKGMEKFHPRSFNMGFSRAVFNKTGGFSAMRFGEDVDLSICIFEAGFKVQLIESAFVYHKRRTSFKQFFKQVYNSGIARINLFKLHPQSLKLVHFLPSIFLVGVIFTLILSFAHILFLIPSLLFILLIFIDSSIKYRKLSVGLLAVVASFIQLTGYGAGFLAGCWFGLVLGKSNYKAFSKNFYK